MPGLLVALALGLAAPASALMWSTPKAVSPGHALNAVDCPSLQLCVAVGDHGSAVTSISPAGAGSGWQAADVDASNRLLGISCPSATLCVAIDNHSRAVASANPAGGAQTWRAAVIDPGRWINAISCPSAHLCVAADRRGGVITSQNPRGDSHAWKRVQVSRRALTSLSCPSTLLCVATEKGGRVRVATRPTGNGAAWRGVTAFRPPGGFPSLSGVACPSVHSCVAAGVAVTDVYSARTVHPRAGSAWASTYVDGRPHVGDVRAGLSCGAPGFCVLFDGSVFGLSNVFATGDSGRTWTAQSLPSASPDQAPPVSAVACRGTSLCVITDRAGDVIVGH
ncbi:MAG: hypothetical protein ACR2JH_07615 [Solirubrobacteraceae bacterium]